jgi:hypothetical protein
MCLILKVKILMKEVSISLSVIKDKVIDQAECFENRLALPQQAKYSYFTKATGGRKNYLKAERAQFLSEEESEVCNRAAFATLGQKLCVFEPTGRASLQTVFSITQPVPSLFVAD